MDAPLFLPRSIASSLWRGQEALGVPQPVVASGHAALDAGLPGGGWPLGALSELLLAPAAHHEWALLLPALAARLQGGAGRVVLVAPPLEPFMPVLQAGGVPAARLCCIRPAVAGSAGAAAAAWACEQALRCRDVLAVLAWLPQAQAPLLRRLQLAAAQHRQLLWVVRPLALRQAASPAPLRLALQGQGAQLLVHVLKRRGPPLAQPVALPACPPLLAAVLQAQVRRRQQLQHQHLPGQAPRHAAPFPTPFAAAAGAAPPRQVPHALAGLATAAP